MIDCIVPNAMRFTISIWYHPLSEEIVGVLFGLDPMEQPNIPSSGKGWVGLFKRFGDCTLKLNSVQPSNLASLKYGMYIKLFMGSFTLILGLASH